MLSAYRTTIVSAAWLTSTTPQRQRPLTWPVHQPDDTTVDYSLDLSAVLADLADVIDSAAISYSPYGEGEITIASATTAGSIVTANLTGGYPGRTYNFNIAVTFAFSEETISFPVILHVSRVTGTTVAVPAPFEGYSTPMDCNTGG